MRARALFYAFHFIRRHAVWLSLPLIFTLISPLCHISLFSFYCHCCRVFDDDMPLLPALGTCFSPPLPSRHFAFSRRCRYYADFRFRHFLSRAPPASAAATLSPLRFSRQLMMLCFSSR